MGFSSIVKTKVMVASARRCCICNRYKGVKIEVHHILQEADGGSNDFKNAIALCFDCHADAGHYNNNHPRGTKFSPNELKAQRARTYASVKKLGIKYTDEPELLYCRYVVCKNFEALKEIVAGDLSRTPFKNALFLDNPISSFLRGELNKHLDEYRHTSVYGSIYNDEEKFWSKNPNAHKTQKSTAEFPFFDTIRTPTKQELVKHIYSKDRLSQELLDSGIPEGEIACAVGSWAPCGNDNDTFQEIYILRSLWGVFLEIVNYSSKPIKLTTLRGRVTRTDSLKYRSFVNTIGTNEDIILPQPHILPNTNVLIPLATALPPLSNVAEQQGIIISDEFNTAQYQQLIHVGMPPESINSFNLIGPAIQVEKIDFEVEGVCLTQPLHKLNLSNLYTLDRHWACGCCPHIFFRNKATGVLRYFGEIFTNHPGQQTNVEFVIPKDIDRMVIAELEYEYTHINSIYIDKVCVTKNISLNKDEFFKISVETGQHVSLTGYYILLSENYSKKYCPTYRNSLVGNFIASSTL